MNKPTVSIIVPVYKSEKYLKECINSILSQTFTDFELILVDDCSPDKCPQICDEYAKQDERIKVIHNSSNQGSVKARRTGLSNSSGDYIQFIDSDDRMEPLMIERLYQKIISENCDIAYCDTIRFTDDGKLTPYVPFDTRGREKPDIIINMIEDNLHQFLHVKLFKKSLFDNIVWPEYQFREDTVICIQLFLNAEKVGYEYSTLYRYRHHPGQITSGKNYPKLKKEEFLNFKKLDEIFRSRGDYELYKPALAAQLDSKKSYKKLYVSYNLMRFFRAFLPYGVIAVYRKLKEKRQKQLFC